MADQRSGPRPAGWKRDPSGRHFGRWWDGEEWTEHVISAEKVQGVDPLAPEPPETMPAPSPLREEPRPARERSSGPARRVPLWVKIATPVAVLIAIAAASGGDDPATEVQVSGPAPAGEAAPGDATSTPAAGDRPIGATAKTGNLEVTVFGVTDPQPAPSRFEEPKDGFRLVSVDVQVANRSNRQERFSSLLGFSLLDVDNRKYDIQLLSSVSPGPPEGELPPGEAIRGFVTFEVPVGATGFRFRAQGNVTAAGAYFRLG